jgi:glucose/mannose-6-phosphate isomerase
MPATLDDLSALASHDPSGMMKQMVDLPAQLTSSLSSKMRIDMRPRKVCLCGLGGSAMGADVLGDHLERTSTVCSSVVRDVKLPNWVDGSTLTILISYSGNTRETLAMYEQARLRNSGIVAITSGGRLMQLCQERNEKLVKVPAGLQPRAALGHLLGAAASVVEAADIAPVASDLRSLLPAISDQVAACAPETPLSRNPAKQIAKRLDGKMPFIYSSTNVRTAGRRWQTQINENSKVLCLASELPEADHNQVVGWVDGPKDPHNVPVILRAASDQGMMADIVRATISIFEDFKLDPIIVELEGSTPLENVMRGMVLGDFVSYYLAMLKGVDPLPVSSITELKKRLG